MAELLLNQLNELDGDEHMSALHDVLNKLSPQTKVEALELLEDSATQKVFNAKQRRRMKRILSNITTTEVTPRSVGVAPIIPVNVLPTHVTAADFTDILCGLRSASDIHQAQYNLNLLTLPSEGDESAYAVEFTNSKYELLAVITNKLKEPYLNKALRRRMSRMLFVLSPAESKEKILSEKRKAVTQEKSKSSIKNNPTKKVKVEAVKTIDQDIQAFLAISSEEGLSDSLTALSKAHSWGEVDHSLKSSMVAKLNALVSDTSPVSTTSLIRRKVTRLLSRCSEGVADMSSKERTEPPPTDVETNFKDVEDLIEKTSSSKKAKTESTASPYFTLFVGQIPYETTAEDLTEFFTKEAKLRGDIKVRLLTNKSTGGSRGMAFLQVEDLTEFDRCLLLNNKLIKGRRINVERSCIKKA
jgi:hypothetical protein